MEFVGSGLRLGKEDFEDFSHVFGIEEEIIRAVCEVESLGGGFLSDKRPKILFEAHVFYKLTKGRYGTSNVSSKFWNKNLYGKGGSHQYERLNLAIHLDREAGLKSASWGLFQIMGMNFGLVDCESVEEFVNFNLKGEREQLELFGRFIENNGLVKYLRNLDFESFTRRYNGSGQVEFYSKKLKESYQKWKEKERNSDEIIQKPRRVVRYGSKGEDVKELQVKLKLIPDGHFGPITLGNVKDFQLNNDLVPDGIVGNITWERLDKL
jgi:hypothetical protein